jgi:hypothetical protein
MIEDDVRERGELVARKLKPRNPLPPCGASRVAGHRKRRSRLASKRKAMGSQSHRMN